MNSPIIVNATSTGGWNRQLLYSLGTSPYAIVNILLLNRETTLKHATLAITNQTTNYTSDTFTDNFLDGSPWSGEIILKNYPLLHDPLDPNSGMIRLNKIILSNNERIYLFSDLTNITVKINGIKS